MTSTRSFPALGWIPLESPQKKPHVKKGTIPESDEEKERKSGVRSGGRALRVALGSTFRLCILRTPLLRSPVK